MQVSLRFLSRCAISWSAKKLVLMLVLCELSLHVVSCARPLALHRISSQLVEASARPEVSAVLPSPLAANLQSEASLLVPDQDIIRKLVPVALASDSKTVPVYVSPFVRPSVNVAPASKRLNSNQEAKLEAPNSYEWPVSESKQHNYATPSDLKTSASYGHHGYKQHHSKGWLDMGAWTGGKGSFGWYADYPVGGKKHHY